MGAKGADTIYPRLLAWPITMLLVLIGWVLFRAETLGQAVAVYSGMVGLNGWAISADQAWRIQNSELLMLAMGGLIATQGPCLKAWAMFSPRSLRFAGGAALMTSSIAALIAQSHSPFLYFQF